MGLSAIALKTDLISKLIGRQDTEAAVEIEQLTRICATARAEKRRVTSQAPQLSFADEVAAARQILPLAGVRVQVSLRAEAGLPAAAGDVLAVALREAVTNILRHSAATSCLIQASLSDGEMWLTVSNDGTRNQAACLAGSGNGTADGGSGLANLAVRVQAAGGRLAIRRSGGRFELAAEVPARSVPSRSLLGLPRLPVLVRCLSRQTGVDDLLAPGHHAHATSVSVRIRMSSATSTRITWLPPPNTGSRTGPDPVTRHPALVPRSHPSRLSRPRSPAGHPGR